MGKKLNVSLGTIHLVYIDIVRRNYKHDKQLVTKEKKQWLTEDSELY